MPSGNNGGTEVPEARGASSQEPLVDRRLELDVLRQNIARVAESRRGHVVLILGESGVGKSRLAAEAAAEARNRGLTVIPVRCLGKGAEPLLPLKEALGAYLGRTSEQIRPRAKSTPRSLNATASWTSTAPPWTPGPTPPPSPAGSPRPKPNAPGTRRSSSLPRRRPSRWAAKRSHPWSAPYPTC
jgi:hypothetical protein